MKAREQKKVAVNMKSKKIEQVETHIKELSSWSQKAHAQSTKQEGVKEFYRKSEANGCTSEVKTKRLEKSWRKRK